jgi:flagellar protein FlgJ
MALTDSVAGAGGQASIFDFGALSGLKREVTQDPTGAGKQAEVAKQFEAVYITMLLKRMREAGMKTGLFDSEQSRMMQSMADEQLALQLATPGIGLAQSLLKQMQAHDGPDLPGSGEHGEAAEGAANAAEQAEGQGQMALDLRGRMAAPRVGSTISPELSALLRVLDKNRPADRQLAAEEGAPDHVVDFVSTMAAPAKAAERLSGVPARLILGQAALESGWGQREIRDENGRTSYNLFGIKAGESWKGKVVNVMTTEYENGVAKKVMQPFRAYNSYAEAFTDYARLIGDSPRYDAVAQARDEVDAARKIQAAGYATDPRYADKLIGVMGQLRGAKHPRAGGI